MPKRHMMLVITVTASLLLPIATSAEAVDGVDAAPSITTELAGGTSFAGSVAIGGTAADDVGVDRVMVGIRDRDSGRWLRPNGSFKLQIKRQPATLEPAGGTSVEWAIGLDLPKGRYAASIVAVDSAGNVTAVKPWVRFRVSEPALPKLLVAAGDVAKCSLDGAHQTADLLDRIFAERSGTVAMLGDGAYENGTLAEYTNCYDPTWGRHKGRTKPAAGNHDYDTPDAAGYFGYFGARAGDPDKGYYAYNRGEWRIIVINTHCAAIGGCGKNSAMYQWVETKLQNNPRRCVLVYGHRPRITSGPHQNGDLKSLWELLHQEGVDIVLSGHDHNYQRFAKIDADGEHVGDGMRAFIVGTGGTGLGEVEDIHPQVRSHEDDHHGVLELELYQGRYTWEFINVDDEVMDSGRGACTV